MALFLSNEKEKALRTWIEDHGSVLDEFEHGRAYLSEILNEAQDETTPQAKLPIPLHTQLRHAIDGTPLQGEIALNFNDLTNVGFDLDKLNDRASEVLTGHEYLQDIDFEPIHIANGKDIVVRVTGYVDEEDVRKCAEYDGIYLEEPSVNGFSVGDIVAYVKAPEHIEIGCIKKLNKTTAFVAYHLGDTCAATPYELLVPIQNSYAIRGLTQRSEQLGHPPYDPISPDCEDWSQ